MSREKSQKRIDIEGYPSECRKYLQKDGAGVWRGSFLFGGIALILGLGYFREWSPTLLFDFAPFAAVVFLLVLLAAHGTWSSRHVVAILPYFPKTHPGVSGGCSFLSGKALARNCVYLDALAVQLGLQPLSPFGFPYEFGGEKIVWHSSEEGLQTFSGLRAALSKNPALLEESEALIGELALIEANLTEAVKLQSPFCLLLRYGDSASGHEMEVRQGYFCYSDSATFSSETCQRRQ